MFLIRCGMAEQQHEPKKIPLKFYRSAAGSELVRDWLNSLPPDDCRAIGLDLMRVQYGWPVGMPLCRSLGKGLWEVRTTLPSDQIARVLFCFYTDQLFVLHGF